MANIEVVDRDRGWKRLFEQVKQLERGAYVKVGVLADTDKGGMHVEGGQLTEAELAAVLEFGTEDGRIPARSFVRSTFEEKREELKQLAGELLIKIVFEDMSVTQALGLMGATLATAVKRKITDGEGVPPPNAPSTARAKASTGKTGRYFKHSARTVGEALAQIGALAAVRTLVDTGRMLGAITWLVVVGGGTKEKE